MTPHEPLDFHVDSNGSVRPLGRITTHRVAAQPAGSFVVPRIAQSDWREFDYTADPSYPVPIMDQNQKGACNWHATASAMMTQRWLSGQPFVSLSGFWGYAILCGGRDVGSSISDGLALMLDKGVAPESAWTWGVIRPPADNDASYAEAAKYKAEVATALDQDFDHIMSAVQLGLSVVLSVHVGWSFDLDSEGVVGASRGAGNHAIHVGVGAKKLRSGRWAIKWPNSWTKAWGQNGYAYITSDHIDGQGWFEAWALRTPIENPADAVTPPVAA